MSNDRINFYYDPSREGYDTALWKTMTGVPAVVGANIQLASASILNYADIYKGNVTFSLLVPAAPTAGDVRFWGFYQPNLDAYIGFDITNDVFSVQASNGNGSTTTVVCDWQPSWTNTEHEYQIQWSASGAVFLVDGVVVVGPSNAEGKINGDSIPTVALSTYISNENADNMLFTYMEAKDIQSYI